MLDFKVEFNFLYRRGHVNLNYQIKEHKICIISKSLKQFHTMTAEIFTVYYTTFHNARHYLIYLNKRAEAQEYA